MFGGIALLPDTNLARLGVGVVAMFVVAAILPHVSILPHVFFYGEPLRKPSRRPPS